MCSRASGSEITSLVYKLDQAGWWERYIYKTYDIGLPECAFDLDNIAIKALEPGRIRDPDRCVKYQFLMSPQPRATWLEEDRIE